MLKYLRWIRWSQSYLGKKIDVFRSILLYMKYNKVHVIQYKFNILYKKCIFANLKDQCPLPSSPLDDWMKAVVRMQN